jgi:hypothetical protein
MKPTAVSNDNNNNNHIKKKKEVIVHLNNNIHECVYAETSVINKQTKQMLLLFPFFLLMIEYNF